MKMERRGDHTTTVLVHGGMAWV